MRINIALVHVGDKYSTDYVTKMVAMVRRNAGRYDPHFYVFTDRPAMWNVDGIVPVNIAPFMTDLGLDGWWGCLSIFDPTLLDAGISHLFYMDIDTVILRSLEPLFDDVRDKEFAASREWGANANRLPLGKGCLFVRPGSLPSNVIWQMCFRDSPVIRRAGGQDQTFINLALQDAGLLDTVHYAPAEMVVSYKVLIGRFQATQADPGSWETGVVLCCHGVPKPDQIIAENWPGADVVARHWVE